MSFVDALKELGCSVAIDDFGAGYTSFRNLKFLAVDMVKIDGSFVKNMTRDRVDRVFIETLVSLARTFNIETVAEWVGDEETAKVVRDGRHLPAGLPFRRADAAREAAETEGRLIQWRPAGTGAGSALGLRQLLDLGLHGGQLRLELAELVARLGPRRAGR